MEKNPAFNYLITFSSFQKHFFFIFQVPIVSKDECKEVYTDYNLTKNMFCAGYKEGGIDSCGGDSGGPLLCKPKGGRWTIWGITSFGKGCGKKGYYGIYAKVPNYISWIRSTISVE